MTALGLSLTATSGLSLMGPIYFHYSLLKLTLSIIPTLALNQIATLVSQLMAAVVYLY